MDANVRVFRMAESVARHVRSEDGCIQKAGAHGEEKTKLIHRESRARENEVIEIKGRNGARRNRAGPGL